MSEPTVDKDVSTASSTLVAAVEQVLEVIRSRHRDVPPVYVTHAKGKTTLGHFHANQWIPKNAAADAPRVAELFVGGEGLAKGVEDVLDTLLHEAAHGIAHTREIQDTSRQGRYHNKNFKALAEEVGLECERVGSIGWSNTTLTETTTLAYAAEIKALDAAISHYRNTSLGDLLGKPSTTRPALVCDCLDRKIRASQKVLALGPIICGICRQEFGEEE